MSEWLSSPDDFLLKFTLDGVKYALENNIRDEKARVELRANLKFWFPDAQIEDEQLNFDDAA